MRSALVLLSCSLLVALAAGPASAGVGPPEGTDPPSNTWPAALAAVGPDDVNVAWTAGALRIADPARIPDGDRAPVVSGIELLTPHPLATPSNLVRAFTTAATVGADVEYRGRRDVDGEQWSEWTPAGRPLPFPTSTVQARIVLTGANASVAAVVLVASTTPSRSSLTAVGNVYRVYATREGLVGGTTANGHVIASRDHFVALPSHRGLAPKGTGDYTIRVCTTTGARCEFAPVWDVGPWNTTDDYWNRYR